MILDKLTARLESVQEYEKEPVPESKLKGWRSFPGGMPVSIPPGPNSSSGPYSSHTA